MPRTWISLAKFRPKWRAAMPGQDQTRSLSQVETTTGTPSILHPLRHMHFMTCHTCLFIGQQMLLQAFT